MGTLKVVTCEYNGEFYYELPSYASGETIGKGLNRAHTAESRNKYAIWKRIKDKKGHLDEIYERQKHYGRIPAFRLCAQEIVNDITGRLSRSQTASSLAKSSSRPKPRSPRSAPPSGRFAKASYTKEEIQRIHDRLYTQPTFSTWVRSVDLFRDPYYGNDSSDFVGTESSKSVRDEDENTLNGEERYKESAESQAHKSQSFPKPKISSAFISKQFKLKEQTETKENKKNPESLQDPDSSQSRSNGEGQPDVTSLKYSKSSSAASGGVDGQKISINSSSIRNEAKNEPDYSEGADYDDDFEDDAVNGDDDIAESERSDSSSEVSEKNDSVVANNKARVDGGSQMSSQSSRKSASRSSQNESSSSLVSGGPTGQRYMAPKPSRAASTASTASRRTHSDQDRLSEKKNSPKYILTHSFGVVAKEPKTTPRQVTPASSRATSAGSGRIQIALRDCDCRKHSIRKSSRSSSASSLSSRATFATRGKRDNSISLRSSQDLQTPRQNEGMGSKESVTYALGQGKGCQSSRTSVSSGNSFVESRQGSAAFGSRSSSFHTFASQNNEPKEVTPRKDSMTSCISSFSEHRSTAPHELAVW
jgi:hypothetical protein